jgi:DNA primase
MSERKKLKILADILGSFYRSGSEYLFSCPSCDHHKKKLSVNIDKNAFKCWICDWSGLSLYRIVRKYGTFPQKNEWKSFEDIVDVSDFSKDLFRELEVQETLQRINLPEEFATLTSSKTYSSTPARSYLNVRGIGRKQILHWKIGYCQEGEYKNRIILPSFDVEGYCNYFIARTYTNDYMKYKNPPVSKDIIFNELYLEWDEELIIVEGAFDAIKAGKNSVPILGSTLRQESRLFTKIVENDTPVLVALDPDAEKKAMRLIKDLLEYGIEVRKLDVAPYSDIGEMPKEEFEKRKKNATFINSSNYLLRRIQSI